MGGRIVAALYIAAFAFASLFWFIQIFLQIMREILRKGGGEKMSKVNERTLSLYEIVPWEKLVEYQINLRKMIEERLRKRLPKEVDIVDIDVDIKEIDAEHARERIEVVLDVTRLFGNDWECIWYDGLYDSCQSAALDFKECIEGSKDYDEEKCKRYIEDCVEDKLAEFKNDYCGLPFEIRYSNPPASKARLVSLEDEDSYRYCCGIGLRYIYTQYPFKDVLRELVESKRSMEYTAEQVASEVIRIVNAVRALA